MGRGKAKPKQFVRGENVVSSDFAYQVADSFRHDAQSYEKKLIEANKEISRLKILSQYTPDTRTNQYYHNLTRKY